MGGTMFAYVMIFLLICRAVSPDSEYSDSEDEDYHLPEHEMKCAWTFLYHTVGMRITEKKFTRKLNKFFRKWCKKGYAVGELDHIHESELEP